MCIRDSSGSLQTLLQPTRHCGYSALPSSWSHTIRSERQSAQVSSIPMLRVKMFFPNVLRSSRSLVIKRFVDEAVFSPSSTRPFGVVSLFLLGSGKWTFNAFGVTFCNIGRALPNSIVRLTVAIALCALAPLYGNSLGSKAVGICPRVTLSSLVLLGTLALLRLLCRLAPSSGTRLKMDFGGLARFLDRLLHRILTLYDSSMNLDRSRSFSLHFATPPLRLPFLDHGASKCTTAAPCLKGSYATPTCRVDRRRPVVSRALRPHDIFFFTFLVVSFWAFLLAFDTVLPLLRELVHFRSLFFFSPVRFAAFSFRLFSPNLVIFALPLHRVERSFFYAFLSGFLFYSVFP